MRILSTPPRKTAPPSQSQSSPRSPDDERRKPARPGIPALTGLRGVAALLVAYSHFGGSGATLGQIGVQIFFVLSAFLMALLYLDAPRGATPAARAKFAAGFFRNRVARVVPLPVFATLLSCALYQIPGLRRYAVYLVKDAVWRYVLLQNAINVQWTIAIEMGFYIFFSVLLLFPIPVSKAILSACVLLALRKFQLPQHPTFERLTGLRWGIITSKFDLYIWFMFGILLYGVHLVLCKAHLRYSAIADGNSARNVAKPSASVRLFLHSVLSAVLVGAATILCVSWHMHVGWNSWRSGMDAAVVFASLLGCLWLTPLSHMLCQPVLMHFGKISYSVYLMHMFVFEFMSARGLVHGKSLPLFIVFLGLTTALATFTFHFIEQPMNKLLRCNWAPSVMPTWATASDDDLVLPLMFTTPRTSPSSSLSPKTGFSALYPSPRALHPLLEGSDVVY